MPPVNYDVVLSDVADEGFDELAKADKGKVISCLERMTQEPFAGAGRMRYVEAELWRKKLGRVRLIFTVDKEAKRVVIRIIDLRTDDTYDPKRLRKSLDWEPSAAEPAQEGQAPPEPEDPTPSP